MKVASTITSFLGRSPLVAAVLYLAAVGLFVVTAALATLSITDHIRGLQETSDQLEQLLINLLFPRLLRDRLKRGGHAARRKGRQARPSART